MFLIYFRTPGNVIWESWLPEAKQNQPDRQFRRDMLQNAFMPSNKIIKQCNPFEVWVYKIMFLMRLQLKQSFSRAVRVHNLYLHWLLVQHQKYIQDSPSYIPGKNIFVIQKFVCRLIQVVVDSKAITKFIKWCACHLKRASFTHKSSPDAQHDTKQNNLQELNSIFH